MKEKIKLLYQMDQISHFNTVAPLTLSTEEKITRFSLLTQKKKSSGFTTTWNQITKQTLL